MSRTMATEQHTYQVQFDLELIAPFISKGTGAMSFGLDTFMQGEPGSLTLNGRLIKGNLRHQLNAFIKTLDNAGANPDELRTVVNSAFGPSEEDDENLGNSQVRGRLEFPWQLEQCEALDQQANNDQKEPSKVRSTDEKRYRIQICPKTGKVEKGHLLVIQTHYPTGTKVPFRGKGYFIGTEDEAKALEKWLKAAAPQIKALGAYKSVGFGQVAKFNVAMDTNNHNKADLLGGGFWTMILKSDRPVCFAKPRTRKSNVFESESYIPGNALKAAIINSRKYQKLKSNALENNTRCLLVEYIDDLIVRHAFSRPKNTDRLNFSRSKTIPQSLLKLEKQYINMALINPKTFFKVKNGGQKVLQYVAGEYQTDWKGSIQDKKLLGLIGHHKYSPNKVLSVHTAINPESGTASKSQLYALESLDHKKNQWLGQVGLTADAYNKLLKTSELAQFISELEQVLAEGLSQLGKTKARLSVASLVEHQLDPVTYADQSETKTIVAIKLETPAQLFTQGQLAAQNNNLTDCYTAYFKNNSPFNLVRHYTDQQLVGGDYLHHRFKTNPKEETYNYEILVAPGSVFVLSFDRKDTAVAEAQLATWLRDGLPVCDKHLNWESTPYISQNGFAEISLMGEELAKFGTESKDIVMETDNG